VKRLPALFLLGLFFVSSLFARSSVWSVSDGRTTLYIGGTVHLLRSADYPLPHEFDRAYERSDYLVFETDIAAVRSDAFAAALMKKMLLPRDKTLKTVLAPATYRILQEYLSSEHYPQTMFEHLQPWGVMLTLTQLQLEKYGIDQSGVDAYYGERAIREGKPCRFFETPEEQIDIITTIGAGEEDAMILQTIEEMKMLPEMMTWMVRDWREGNMHRIHKELVETMEQESPQTYRTILSGRNEQWLLKLAALMDEGKTGLILVGAMHLPGNGGLLERLRRLGYRVEPFSE